LAASQRFEDAARLRDRVAALEEVVAAVARLDRLRQLRACLLVPALEPGFTQAFFVVNGRVAARRPIPPGGGAISEALAGLADALACEPSLAPEHADELLLVDQVMRRPPPELRVCPLDAHAIAGACSLAA
ncbi:MAG: hypothetical protein FJW96_02270, partial [Actinobacteria bacterium]|nr:hypothetical protein [Actinomycetota bacterium]